MSSIRVFLVDDTAIIRRVLTQILEEESDLVVVGTATNGAEALQRLPQIEVDLIVLDVEMPGMGGLDMLRELRRSGNSLPVLLFSSVTERGAMVTIEALLLGASDYVTKPSMMGSAAAAREHIRLHLLPRIRHLCGRKSPVAVTPVLATHRRPQAAGQRPGQIEAVVIGVSTGGPNALSELLPRLPADLPVPVFIVQHMPPLFTRALAERLSRVSAVRVQECEAPQRVVAGTVWLATGGRHMRLMRDAGGVSVLPDDGEPENFCRPAADVLFRSAVEVFGGRLLGVVMTGMGHDGLAGCRGIRAAGGQVIIQDEISSVVWGMPAAVQREGLANGCLPLEALAGEILERVAVGRPWFKPGAQEYAAQEAAP